jgi:hypothetical protein
VGADEGCLVGDRAVDVRLGGEVDHGVAAAHDVGDELAVLDRSLHEAKAVDDTGEVLAAPRVGQLVEDDQLVLGPRLERRAHVGGPDESGAPANEQPHAAALARSST